MRLFVHGCGAVTPAGWGMEAMRGALHSGASITPASLARPAGQASLPFRKVAPPLQKIPALAHARLRRSSPIAQYSIAAALEALGPEALAESKQGKLRLGILLAAMSGCVNYSRRFYDEALRDPSTASPLVFPETVFNAPASHIGASIGTQSINYTLVGDPGTYLQALALAAQWLEEGIVDGCLVIGSEEGDWLTSGAFRLFVRSMVLSDGAGAVFVSGRRRSDSDLELSAITSPQLYTKNHPRPIAARMMREQLGPQDPATLLVDGLQNLPKLDRAESDAWQDWRGPRLSPKQVLGEGLAAASAWQCIVAMEALRKQQADTAVISVVGCNQQSIAATITQPQA